MTDLTNGLWMFFLVALIVLPSMVGLTMSLSGMTIKITIDKKHKTAAMENRRRRNLYLLEGQ
jgi:hypothetical protein